MGGCVLVAALTLGAPGPKEPKAHPLVGTWQLLTHTHDGQTADFKAGHCWTFTADGRRGAHTFDTRPALWQKYALDEKVRPPALSVTEEYRTGPITEHFRFEVDGDTLTMCTRSEGRPEAITAERGTGNTVYKLWRVKAKELHPDVKPGDKEAAKAFHAFSLAYEVLRAAEERREWKG